VVDAEKAFIHLKRPFASINLDALDQNIKFVNEHVQGKGVRIATKSVRSTSFLNYIAERLDNHFGLMTFDLCETLSLLNDGFDDCLIGYPQYDHAAMEGIIQHILGGKTVIFMVDCLEQWRRLDEIGKVNKVVFEICIDINVSTDFKLLYFGTKRSSLKNVDDVTALLESTRTFKNTKLTGVMGYEAQIAGISDSPVATWQKPLIKQLKKIAQRKVRELRRSVVDLIQKEIGELRFVNGGGSGSIDFTAGETEVTELTIGSAFYYPALFSGYKSLPLEHATTFALRVTRRPTHDTFVCHGGGYIASGAVGVDKNPVPIWPENLFLLKNEGAGEVQTPLRDKSEQLQIGDTVYFRHAKAGELCERFTELHARRGAVYEGSFKTYRGEGGCYL